MTKVGWPTVRQQPFYAIHAFSPNQSVSHSDNAPDITKVG